MPDRGSADRPGSVLLIEDDVDVRRFLHERLTAQGFLVSEAPNGERGLELLERATRRRGGPRRAPARHRRLRRAAPRSASTTRGAGRVADGSGRRGRPGAGAGDRCRRLRGEAVPAGARARRPHSCTPAAVHDRPSAPASCSTFERPRDRHRTAARWSRRAVRWSRSRPRASISLAFMASSPRPHVHPRASCCSRCGSRRPELAERRHRHRARPPASAPADRG